MSIGFYAVASLMDAQMKQHEVIATNITAASKPGSKQVISTVSSDASGKINVPDNFEAILEGQMPKVESSFNFSSGAIHHNGNPFSFAVSGPGFFEVQTAAGEKLYTRNGSFHASPTYDLIDGYGNLVLGTDGPIKLLPEGGSLYVDTSGQMFQGSEKIGQLSLVNIPPNGVIPSTGGYRIDPAKGAPATPVDNPSILQGAQEESNFSIVHSLVQLVDTSRFHEMGQQLMKTYDERQSIVNEKLGQVR